MCQKNNHLSSNEYSNVRFQIYRASKDQEREVTSKNATEHVSRADQAFEKLNLTGKILYYSI